MSGHGFTIKATRFLVFHCSHKRSIRDQILSSVVSSRNARLRVYSRLRDVVHRATLVRGLYFQLDRGSDLHLANLSTLVEEYLGNHLCDVVPSDCLSIPFYSSNNLS